MAEIATPKVYNLTSHRLVEDTVRDLLEKFGNIDVRDLAPRIKVFKSPWDRVRLARDAAGLIAKNPDAIVLIAGDTGYTVLLTAALLNITWADHRRPTLCTCLRDRADGRFKHGVILEIPLF